MNRPLVIDSFAGGERLGSLGLRFRPMRIERLVGLRVGQTDPLHVIQQREDVRIEEFALLLARNEGAGQLCAVDRLRPRFIRIGLRHRKYCARQSGSLGAVRRPIYTESRDDHQGVAVFPDRITVSAAEIISAAAE